MVTTVKIIETDSLVSDNITGLPGYDNFPAQLNDGKVQYDDEWGLSCEVYRQAKLTIDEPGKFVQGYQDYIETFDLAKLMRSDNLSAIVGQLNLISHLLYAGVHSGNIYLFNRNTEVIRNFYDHIEGLAEKLLVEYETLPADYIFRLKDILAPFFINFGIYFDFIKSPNYAIKSLDIAKRISFCFGKRQFYFDAQCELIAMGLAPWSDEIIAFAEIMDLRFYSQFSDDPRTMQLGKRNINRAHLLCIRQALLELLDFSPAFFVSAPEHTAEILAASSHESSPINILNGLIDQLEHHSTQYAINNRNQREEYSVLTGKILTQAQILLAQIARNLQHLRLPDSLKDRLNQYLVPQFWMTDTRKGVYDNVDNRSVMGGLALRNLRIEHIGLFNALYDEDPDKKDIFEELLFNIARSIAGFSLSPYSEIEKFLSLHAQNYEVQRFMKNLEGYLHISTYPIANVVPINNRQPIPSYLVNLLATRHRDVNRFLDETFETWTITVRGGINDWESYVMGNAHYSKVESSFINLSFDPNIRLYYSQKDNSSFIPDQYITRWLYNTLSPDITRNLLHRLSETAEQFDNSKELLNSVLSSLRSFLQRYGTLLPDAVRQGFDQLVGKILSYTHNHPTRKSLERRRAGEGNGKLGDR